MNKFKLIYVVLASLVAILFFQNCGQVGSLALQKASEPVGAFTDENTPSDENTPGLIIAPPVTPPSSGQNTPPAGGSTTGGGSTVADGGNTSGGNTSHHEDDKDDEEEAPVTSPVADSDDNSDENKTINCGDMVIQDVQLQVDRLEATKGSSSSSALANTIGTVSIHQPHIQFKSLRSEKNVNQVRIVLGKGSRVLTNQDQVLDLKTPSAEQSGIKVHLDTAIDLVKDKTYVLELNIDQNQLKVNGEKCMFHPVIKSANIN